MPFNLRAMSPFWILMSCLATGIFPSSGSAEGLVSRDFAIEHWTTEEGLPSNTIRALLQTRDGYIWVGTKGGLARFDGVRFKVFTKEIRFEDGADLSCWDLVLAAA